MTLEIPLAINLQRRAIAEVESSAKSDALVIAERIGAERVQQPSQLQAFVYDHFSHTEDGRVIVVDPEGVLIADSMGPDNLGTLYATPGRYEIGNVIRTQKPYSVRRHSDTLGQDILVAAAPILDENRFYGVVRQTRGVGIVQDRVRAVIYGLIIIGLAALIAGLIIAFALAGSLSRPLTRLAAAARRLGEGDLSARADATTGATEIAQLAESFDEMADRLESTVKAQREFVANASHQLRTPLTGMKLRLESAIAEVEDDNVRRNLEAADKEVDRLAEIIERLLVMAHRIEQGGPGEVEVGEAVQRAVERWEERASRLGATLLAKGDGGRALADGTELDQILDNLLDNAISYAPGPVIVQTGRSGEHLFVAVEDRGPGIPAEERHRVTDRFFRGRGAPPGGSGLGLAIVRELSEKWGGDVEVKAVPTGGTRVEVRLKPANRGAP